MRALLRFKVQVFYYLVIFLASLKVIAFAVAIYAEHNKEHVEALASTFIGTRIHIEHIKTSWSGFTPKLRLKNLAVGANRELRLGDALVSVSLLELPYWQQNLPLKIKLKGTRVHAVRDKQGKTRIKGLLGTTKSAVNLPARIRINDATLVWEDHKRNGVQLQLEHVNIHLLTRGDRARLNIQSTGQQLMARADIQGSIGGSEWSAKTYIEARKLDAVPFLAPYMPKPYLLDGLDLDIRAWGEWSQGVHTKTRAIVDVAKLHLEFGEEKQLDLDSLKSDLLYEHTTNGWRLQLAGLSFFGKHHHLEPTDIMLNVAPVSGSAPIVDLAVNRIQLQETKKLLQLRSPNHRLAEMLNNLNPRGDLHNIRFSMEPGEASDWRFNAGLEGLYSSNWNKIPEINNLSGHISATPRLVTLDLDTRDAVVFPAKLFRTPIKLQKLQGRLSLNLTDKTRWTLSSEELVAENADLKTRSRLRIAAIPEQPLFIDMQTDFKEGNGRSAGGYYPVGIMSPRLVGWLDESIVAGDVTHGSFILYGPVKGFPYHEEHTGHFEVLFNVENAELAYREKWPSLTAVDATVRFHNNSLEISSDRGTIYSTGILQANASIESLRGATEIKVTGETRGPLADQFRLLRETPLRENLAKTVSGMDATGEASLSSSFTIPLKPENTYDFSGKLRFLDSGLQLTEHDLDLSRITGLMTIDLEGVNGTGITAESMGGDLTLDIRQGGDSTTLIEADANIPVSGLYQQFPFLTVIPAAGELVARVNIEIPRDTTSEASLAIQSDLNGLQIDLPQPVGKTGAEAGILDINVPLSPGSREVSIHYSDHLELSFNIDQSDAVHVRGRLPEIVLKEWKPYFSRRPEQQDSPDWRTIDILFDAFDIGISRIEGLSLQSKKTARGWEGTLQSNDLNGNFRIPRELENGVITAALDRLDIAYKYNEDTPYYSDEPEEALSPVDFPALAFSCRKLMLNGGDLGQLHLLLKKSEYGLEVSELHLRGGLLSLSAQGSWEQYPATQLSELKGTFSSEKMEQLLGLFTDDPVFVEGDTDITFDLSWYDALHEFALEKLEGSLQLNTGQGRFLRIKPGAARILGLINVRSLDRRLKLDFSDVTKKGFAFDNIMGSFSLDKGLLFTNDLSIKAPSSQINIAGMADLALETADMLITVTPRLDATLPVAGAVMGGPVTGIAVLVAQQALSSKLEKFQRLRYSVQGSWENPEVTYLKLEGEEEESNLLEH